MTNNTLPARLREATQGAHRRIDHHPALAPLIRSSLSLDHYIDVLRAMAWIYQTLDGAFAGALATHCPGDTYRCSERSRWLAVDLAYFRRDDPLPPPWCPPAIESVPALVGRLYAIEGSTLGGQVIAQRVAASLGLDVHTGACMFHGHGTATSMRWAEFQAFAARACHPDATESACEAANMMFDEFGDLLDRWAGGPGRGRSARR